MKQQPEKGIFGLFVIFLWAAIRMCEVVKHPQTLPKRSNQQIKEVNRNLYGKINHFGNIIFVSNQEQNKTYTLKDMLL